MLYNKQGPFSTAAANASLRWTTAFPSFAFVGPIAIAGNVVVVGFTEDFANLTAGDITVQAVAGNDSTPNEILPTSFTYSYTVKNDSPVPITYDISIGTFQ